MRVRYSKSSRHTGHLANIKKQREKYPRLLLKVIEISDIILEVLDARFIKDTRNFEIENYIKKKNKKIIYVFNKSDLIEEKNKDDFKDLYPHVFVSSTKRRGGKELRDRIKREAKEVKKDINNKFDRIQVGVIGYPNTGKSSVINLLVGKTSARTGAEAGFTKGIQKLKLTTDLLLIDSPGVIPRREYSQTASAAISKHTMVGARTYDKVKEPEIVVNDLMLQFKDSFEKFYKTKAENSEELIEELGKKKNIFRKGGDVDDDRVARMILRDWQEGKIKI